MPLTESLAATIRKIFNKAHREQAITRLVWIATDSGCEVLHSMRAFELLARYGWPDEKSGAVGLRISGKGAQVLVQHIHQPIGLASTSLDDVELQRYEGVKLGSARHCLEASPETVAETPGSPTDDDPLAGPPSDPST